MSDAYVQALEQDRDTRAAELARCRSEVERFVAEVERLEKRGAWLDAEVEEARAALKASQEQNDTFMAKVERLTHDRDEALSLAAQLERSAMDVTHERAEAIRERDEWRASSADWEAVAKREKARAEAAEADLRKTREVLGETQLAKRMAEGDNAALVQTLRQSCSGMHALDWVSAILLQPHPGAALLERLRAAEKVVEAQASLLATYLPEERHGWALLCCKRGCASLSDEEATCSCGGTEQGRRYEMMVVAREVYDAAKEGK